MLTHGILEKNFKLQNEDKFTQLTRKTPGRSLIILFAILVLMVTTY